MNTKLKYIVGMFLGALFAIPLASSALSIFTASQGGTGSGVIPSFGQILVGLTTGNYQASSSPTIAGTVTANNFVATSTATSTFPVLYSSTSTISNLNGVIVVDGIRFTQNGTGIQSAINFCASQGGGNVYLPAALYLASSTIAFPSDSKCKLTSPKFIKVNGGGAEIRASGAMTNLISITGGFSTVYTDLSNDQGIENVYLNGNNLVINVVYAENVDYLTLDSVRMTGGVNGLNTAYNGVYPATDASVPGAIMLRNSLITTKDNAGGSNVILNTQTQTWIMGNWFDGISSSTIVLASSTKIKIIGNEFNQSDSNIIFSDGVSNGTSNITINGNNFNPGTGKNICTDNRTNLSNSFAVSMIGNTYSSGIPCTIFRGGENVIQPFTSLNNGDISLVPDGTGKVGIGTSTPRTTLTIGSGQPILSFYDESGYWHGCPDPAGVFNIQNFQDQFRFFRGVVNDCGSEIARYTVATNTSYAIGISNRNIGGIFENTSLTYFSTSTSWINNGGNFGVGTTSPYAKLSVVGEIVGAYFTGTTTATSTFGGNLAINGTGTTTSAGGFDITSGCFAVGGTCIGGVSGTGASTTLLSDLNVFSGATNTIVFLSSSRSTSTQATSTNFFSSILTATSGFLTNLFVTGSSTLQDVTMRNTTTSNATTTSLYVSGRTGLGATAPITTLDVRSANANTGSTVGGNVNIGSSDAQNIDIGGSLTLGGFNDNSASVYRVFGSIEGRKSTNVSGSSNGYLVFKTDLAGGLTERMRILDSGNVGIGTTSPYAKLSVVGETVSAFFTATTTSNNTFPNLLFTNATGTQATTTNLAVSSVASKILLTNATGGVTGYAGASCTNQFVRSISALGAATCATVAATDVALANLTATNASLTFSGTYTGATARTIGLNLGNANVWTALQTFNTAGLISTASSTIRLLSSTNSTSTNATSTNFFSTYVVGTKGTITNLIATNSTTTNATSTTGYFSGVLSGLQSGFTGRISPIKRLSYVTATSTAWTATTSGAYLPPIIAPFAGTIQTAQCSTDAGTLNVDVYHTSTHLALFNASTTVGTITFSTNNTVTNGEKIYISAGTPASTPTVLSCTLSITESL